METNRTKESNISKLKDIVTINNLKFVDAWPNKQNFTKSF